MTTMHRKIETLANVCIVVLCLLVGGYVIHDRVFAWRDGHSQTLVGHRISMSGLKPISDNKFVVLLLSTECKYCSMSLPFYRSLKLSHPNLKVVASFNDGEPEAAKYLASHGVAVDQVLGAQQLGKFTSVTPTMLLVDNHENVKAEWVGYQSPGAQQKILEALQ